MRRKRRRSWKRKTRTSEPYRAVVGLVPTVPVVSRSGLDESPSRSERTLHDGSLPTEPHAAEVIVPPDGLLSAESGNNQTEREGKVTSEI